MLPVEAAVKEEEFAHAFSLNDVTISPGINRLTLQMKADCEGVFALSQFVVRSRQIEFIRTVDCSAPNLTVIKVVPTVTILKSSEDLLAGTEQDLELVIKAGSMAFDKVLAYRTIS